MKKIVVLILITLLFSSCSLFNKGKDENMWGEENPIVDDTNDVEDTNTGNTDDVDTWEDTSSDDIKENIWDNKSTN